MSDNIPDKSIPDYIKEAAEKEYKAGEQMIRELIYIGFAQAAGAFRLYPDNKHTFADHSDYLMKEGKKIYDKFASPASLRYHQSPDEGWINEKPVFDQECVFMTAHYIKGQWGFDSWRICRVDSEEGWYWGLCNLEGEEWGPLEDLSEQLYFILPSPVEQPSSLTRGEK